MSEAAPRLLIDASCGFCRAAAGWCERGVALEVQDGASLSTEQLAGLGTTAEVLSREVVLLEEARPPVSGAAAVSRLLVLRGGGWSLLGRAMGRWPISIAASLGYRVVARLRHRLPGAAR